MIMLINVLLWSVFGLAVLVKFYGIIEASGQPFPQFKPGKLQLASTVMVNSEIHSTATHAAALVLFSVNDANPPSCEILNEISAEIFDLYATDQWFDSVDINEFIKFLKDDDYQRNRRYRVPTQISRGHDLYVSDLILYRDHLHPSHRQLKLVAVRVKGQAKGSIHQIPWTDPEALQLFADNAET